MQEAGDAPALLELDQRRFRRATDGHNVWATRGEAAATRHVDRVRHLAGQIDSCTTIRGIGNWHRGDQCLSVRVQRPGEDRVRRSLFYDLAEVHDRDLVTDVI